MEKDQETDYLGFCHSLTDSELTEEIVSNRRNVSKAGKGTNHKVYFAECVILAERVSRRRKELGVPRNVSLTSFRVDNMVAV